MNKKRFIFSVVSILILGFLLGFTSIIFFCFVGLDVMEIALWYYQWRKQKKG